MSFLETWQKKQSGNTVDLTNLLAKGKNVIVLGGGDTGCDCIATSLRQVWLQRIRIMTVSLSTEVEWVLASLHIQQCDSVLKSRSS